MLPWAKDLQRHQVALYRSLAVHSKMGVIPSGPLQGLRIRGDLVCAPALKAGKIHGIHGSCEHFPFSQQDLRCE